MPEPTEQLGVCDRTLDRHAEPHRKLRDCIFWRPASSSTTGGPDAE